MNCRLVVAARAEADLQEGFVWYEKRLPGLGHDFIRRVEAKFERLAHSPQHFRLHFGPYRLAAVERFPYAIYFIWDESNAVIAVRRVLHFKQDRQTRL